VRLALPVLGGDCLVGYPTRTDLVLGSEARRRTRYQDLRSDDVEKRRARPRYACSMPKPREYLVSFEQIGDVFKPGDVLSEWLVTRGDGSERLGSRPELA
jgi:hypothetical protein